MSALPKAIQAQLDQAEAIQAQMAEPAPQEGNPEPEVTPEQPGLQLVQQEPQQEAQVTPPVVPEETWEQRFKIMEGKFKAEVPRLYEQNRQLSEQLETAIKALESAKKPEPPAQETKLVTDADVEAYGGDLVDMVRRAAREEFNTLSKAFAAELDRRFGAVAEQVQRTESHVVKSETEKFWDKITLAHADFDVINEDPRWSEFLNGAIPGTRLTRRQVAEDAVQRMDSVVLIEQVKLFKEAAGIGQPQPAPKAKPNLNAQVAPSSSRASTPTPDAAKRIWTGREYQEALDHRNLQHMSREAYEARIAEAEQALAEGRVQF